MVSSGRGYGSGRERKSAGLCCRPPRPSPFIPSGGRLPPVQMRPTTFPIAAAEATRSLTRTAHRDCLTRPRKVARVESGRLRAVNSGAQGVALRMTDCAGRVCDMHQHSRLKCKLPSADRGWKEPAVTMSAARGTRSLW